MRYLVAFLIVAAVLLSGCVSDGSGPGTSPIFDAEQSFKELAEKGKGLPDGYYKYKVTVAGSSVGSSGYTGSVSFDAELYKLGSRSKKVLWMAGSPMTYYEVDGNVFECSGLLGDVSCELDEYGLNSFDSLVGLSGPANLAERFALVKAIYEFRYEGSRQFGGRNCQDFSFTLSEERLRSMMPEEYQGLEIGGSARNSICLDSQQGFLVRYSKQVSAEAPAAGESRSMESGSELLEFSPNVSEEDLEFPIDFEIQKGITGDREFECFKDRIEISVKYWNDFGGEAEVWFRPDGIDIISPKAQMDEIIAEPADFTVNLDGEAGQWETLSFQIGQRPNEGDNMAVICVKDKGCYSAECRYRPVQEYDSCLDSDGGMEPYVKGEVTYLYADRPGSDEDYCRSIHELGERYCEGGDVRLETIDCLCIDGVCIESGCFDSDGLDYETKGYCFDTTGIDVDLRTDSEFWNFTFPASVGESHICSYADCDSCWGSNGGVDEYFCSDGPESKCVNDIFNCQALFGEGYACENGKCVPSAG